MKKTISGHAATPQQIYLRRAAHSAAMYLGYECRTVDAATGLTTKTMWEEIPGPVLDSPILELFYRHPQPTAHPSVHLRWDGPEPQFLAGQETSLGTYTSGLAREILARMGPGAREANHEQ